MPFILANRVKDTTTTTGTGTITLSGTAPLGYQTFGAGIGNGNTTYYTITAGSEWEVGVGTYSSTGPTLSRDTVLSSSAGGTTKVTFSAGTKDVFVTLPSERTGVFYPQNTQSSNYTLVLSDASDFIYSANSAAQTITIPTNASVPFDIGATVTIVNMGTYPIRLSGSGVTILSNGSTTALTYPTVASGQNVQLVKTATNTWNCTFGSLNNAQFSYLIVAGGGAGGGVPAGGGGGAGGMLTGVSNVTTGTLTITVGGGGAATSAQGNNSSITGLGTAFGGGGGGPTTSISINGGSGGGCNQGYTPSQTVRGGVGLYGQGNSGGASLAGLYVGAGGGGAGAVGTNVFNYDGGTGGTGIASSITGSSVTYAGGGTGGSIYGPSYAGGTGGGGTGGGNAANGGSGTANTGGGGGGAGDYSYPNPGAGGSGVVIISTPIAATSTTGSPTVTTSGANTIYTFTSSGTITW